LCVPQNKKLSGQTESADLKIQKFIMASTTTKDISNLCMDVNKLIKQNKKLEKDFSVVSSLLVSMEKRMKHLEDGKEVGGDNRNVSNKNSSVPPFILNGTQGYKSYLTTTFRMNLRDKFSHLEYIQQMR
jgi:hypothetical protein